MGLIEFSNYRQEYRDQMRTEREKVWAQRFEERQNRLEGRIDTVCAKIDAKTTNNGCALM